MGTDVGSAAVSAEAGTLAEDKNLGRRMAATATKTTATAPARTKALGKGFLTSGLWGTGGGGGVTTLGGRVVSGM